MKINGHGSIIPLEQKSRYKCRKWRLYVSTDCGQRTRVIHGKWTDAQKALESFKSELADKIPDNETFGAYAASWLLWRQESDEFAPGTLTNNKREIAAFDRCELSTMALSEITPEDCRNALLWLKSHPARSSISKLSNTTMNKLYITLSAIFSQAVDDGRISRNPMAKIKAPKPDTKEKRALTPDELARFVHDLDSLPLDGRTMALYFIALLGLRRSEACAISLADVNDNILFVHRAIKERNGAIGEPKSAASIRRLPMPDVLVDKLAEWTDKRALYGFTDAQTLCCNTRGGTLRPQLLQRWWTGDAKHNGIRDKLGYSDITLHQLRHSNLSMIARHVSPFDLQRYAGWSSIEPAKVYVHDDLDKIALAVRSIW